MVRLKNILLAFMAPALVIGFGWNVDASHAHPSGHSHKHIVSSHHDRNHGKKTVGRNKCPMHKYYSTTPCPHKRVHTKTADPEQCKIGPECGGGSKKSVHEKSGTDENHAMNNKTLSLDSPEIQPAAVFLRAAHNSPQPDSPWRPPKHP